MEVETLAGSELLLLRSSVPMWLINRPHISPPAHGPSLLQRQCGHEWRCAEAQADHWHTEHEDHGTMLPLSETALQDGPTSALRHGEECGTLGSRGWAAAGSGAQATPAPRPPAVPHLFPLDRPKWQHFAKAEQFHLILVCSITRSQEGPHLNFMD